MFLVVFESRNIEEDTTEAKNSIQASNERKRDRIEMQHLVTFFCKHHHTTAFASFSLMHTLKAIAMKKISIALNECTSWPSCSSDTNTHIPTVEANERVYLLLTTDTPKNFWTDTCYVRKNRQRFASVASLVLSLSPSLYSALHWWCDVEWLSPLSLSQPLFTLLYVSLP